MIEFGIFIGLLVIGYVFGRINEAAHFADLDRREAAATDVELSNLKQIPQGMGSSMFVSGSVVVSIDYYKQVAAGLRSLVGGQVGSYQTVLTRARREATLRMIEAAKVQGFGYIGNIRLQTSSVFQNAQGTGSFELYVYGTALK